MSSHLPSTQRALRAAVVMLTVLLAAGCSEIIGERGSGDLVTETLDVAEFDSIEVHRAFRATVTVDPAATQSVTVTIDDNLVEYLDIHVSGGVLVVDATQNLRPSSEARVEVVVPSLEAVDASGASRVQVSGTIEARRVRVDISGASTATVHEVRATDLDLFAAGASRIEVEGGEVERMIVDVSGASTADVDRAISVRAEVDASGASTVHVHATEVVRGSASGASTVNVYGQPGTVDVDTSGASNVRESD